MAIIRAYADKLQFVEMVNELIPSQMEISPGLILLALVLDTLSGHAPLYGLEQSF